MMVLGRRVCNELKIASQTLWNIAFAAQLHFGPCWAVVTAEAKWEVLLTLALLWGQVRMQHNGGLAKPGRVLSKFAKLVPPPQGNPVANSSAAIQRALPKIAGLYR